MEYVIELLEKERRTIEQCLTEWDMQQPFNCHCGARNCLKAIKGAAHLSPAQLKKYRLSNFVLEQLKLPVSKKS